MNGSALKRKRHLNNCRVTAAFVWEQFSVQRKEPTRWTMNLNSADRDKPRLTPSSQHNLANSQIVSVKHNLLNSSQRNPIKGRLALQCQRHSELHKSSSERPPCSSIPVVQPCLYRQERQWSGPQRRGCADSSPWLGSKVDEWD